MIKTVDAMMIANKLPHPGVNFTNVLQAAFTHADPKSTIKLLNLTVFFALLIWAGKSCLQNIGVIDPRCLNSARGLRPIIVFFFAFVLP